MTALKEKLGGATHICLTVDLWSNRQMKGFLGITGHFIHNWQMQSAMIACKRFIGRHTAENICHMYDETLAFYDIQDKVDSVISDNAANMIKAFNFSIPGCSTSNHNDDDMNVPLDLEMDEVAHGIFEYFPKHLRCFAHSLQLVVKDGMKDCSGNLNTVIAKASTFVTFARKSIHATEMLEGEKKLQAANATRWNSQYHMLQSVLNISEEKLNAIGCSTTLTSYERKLLSELCQILEPFQDATLLVQNEKSVSGSLTIPVTLGLLHKVQNISTIYNTKMMKTLKACITDRLGQYEQEDEYVLASILDPRFKLRWSSAENLQSHMTLLNKVVEKNTQIQKTSSDDDSSPPAKKGKDDFFSFMPATPRKRHNSGLPTVELDKYLAEPCIDIKDDPLLFWQTNSNQYPVLSKMAIKYLCTPASSAPVERLFSIAGKVFRPDRCRLNDDTFENLMMIKCNMNL